MIADATSAHQYNLALAQVEEFLPHLPELRHMTEVPWGFKGGERDRTVVKFGCMCFNYFAANRKKQPLHLVQGRRDLTEQVAREMQRFLQVDPPNRTMQDSSVCC